LSRGGGGGGEERANYCGCPPGFENLTKSQLCFKICRNRQVKDTR